ncbi:hypothetical protein DFJ73DRAFT_873961 [Zopfochytrium polystomum]|nr:hypothetical protein DFJ73DRAFT_873961 [Zopfochytrium polystomum]
MENPTNRMITSKTNVAKSCLNVSLSTLATCTRLALSRSFSGRRRCSRFALRHRWCAGPSGGALRRVDRVLDRRRRLPRRFVGSVHRPRAGAVPPVQLPAAAEREPVLATRSADERLCNATHSGLLRARDFRRFLRGSPVDEFNLWRFKRAGRLLLLVHTDIPGMIVAVQVPGLFFLRLDLLKDRVAQLGFVILGVLDLLERVARNWVDRSRLQVVLEALVAHLFLDHLRLARVYGDELAGFSGGRDLILLKLNRGASSFIRLVYFIDNVFTLPSRAVCLAVLTFTDFGANRDCLSLYDVVPRRQVLLGAREGHGRLPQGKEQQQSDAEDSCDEGRAGAASRRWSHLGRWGRAFGTDASASAWGRRRWRYGVAIAFSAFILFSGWVTSAVGGEVAILYGKLVRSRATDTPPTLHGALGGGKVSGRERERERKTSTFVQPTADQRNLSGALRNVTCASLSAD